MRKSPSKGFALSLIGFFLISKSVQASDFLEIKENNLPQGRYQKIQQVPQSLISLKEFDIKLESLNCLNLYDQIQIGPKLQPTFEFWIHSLALNCYRNLNQKKLQVSRLVKILDKLIQVEKKLILYPHLGLLKEQILFVTEMTFLAQPSVAMQRQIINRVNKLKHWFEIMEWERYLAFSGQKSAPQVARSNDVSSAPSEKQSSNESDLISSILEEKSINKRLKSSVEFLEEFKSSKFKTQLLDYSAKAFVSTDSSNLDPKVRELHLKVLAFADYSSTLNRMSHLYYRGRALDAIQLGEAAVAIHQSADLRDQLELQLGRMEMFIGEYGNASTKLKRVAASEGSLRYEAAFSLGTLEMRRGRLKKANEHFNVIHRETKDTALTGMALNYLYHNYDKLGDTSKRNAIKSVILTDYGLTYSGLRILLSLPAEEVILPWREDVSPIEVKWTVTSAQKASYLRFTELIKYGWYKEAQVELRIFALPVTDEDQVIIGLLEVAAHDFRGAIRRFTDLWNKDRSLRTKSRVIAIYPKLFWDHVQKYSAAHSMDPFLMLSLMRQESSFDRAAISVSDARGLMQLLIPSGAETAQLLRVKVANLRGDLFDPELNIRFGTHYFRRMLRMFGENVPLALSAYNAGPGRIRRWLDVRNFGPEFVATHEPIPIDDLWVDELPWNETRLYSKSILRNWLIYKLLYSNENLRDFHPVWKKALISQK